MPHLERNLGIPRARHGRDSGFTLIELMVVVIIVGILAAIALPSYAEYVRRSKISEAISNLSDMRTRLEQFFLDNRTYPTSCSSADTSTTNIKLSPAQKYFAVTCSNLTATTYLVTATGQPGQGMAASFVYTINQANARTSAGPGGQYTSASCWAIRKDGSCT